MSIAQTIAEDRRLSILKCVSEMATRVLNEDCILRAVAETGRDTDHDLMRDDLAFLEKRGCVRIEKLPNGSSDVWMVCLTAAGVRVSRGEQIVTGVARHLTV